MTWETVIGLETHVELATRTKIFCACTTEFGGAPNTHCCPVCTGMPGALPVVNEKVLEFAVKAGLALNGTITRDCRFDRKNYFYPDLPKAYQVSQLYLPIVRNGKVPIQTASGVEKTIRIHELHMEEDAGKLVHDPWIDQTRADYNRCGIPLIEIVTEPDMSSAEEAMAFVEQVSLLLQYAGVCDCKMEQGSLRCDVNISIMKPTDKEFGTRAEIKNINSIKSVGRAIKYEERRQALLLEAGKKVIQETRRYDANRDTTKSMRTKENAHDYRYFPEPDILQVNITDEQLAEIRAKLPEMPNKRFARYTEQYGLSDIDAQTIINNKDISDFFDAALAVYDSPKTISAFILTEFMRRINLGEIDVKNVKFTPAQLAELVRMADTEKISKNDAKTVFRTMAEQGGDPEKLAEKAGFIIIVDTEKVGAEIDKILAANAAQVQQYASGEKKVFGFIMGQCTKALKGFATPKLIKGVLEEKLAAVSVADDTADNKAEEEESYDISALTPYTNPDKYVPETDGAMLMVSPEKLLGEFTLSDALNNIGKVVDFKAYTA